MGDAPSPSRLGPLRAFAYPQFRILWGASLASITAFFMVMMARGWLVLELTDSAFMVTAVNAVGMLPMLALSLFGGVIADRMNRRLVLMASDAFNMVVVLAQGLLVVAGVEQVWPVFALAVLNGVGFALGMPARAATVSNVVNPRDLSSGVALFTTIFSSAQMVGPALAGYLINVHGMWAPFMVSGVLLVPALALLTALRVPVARTTRKGAPSESILDSILGGLDYVRQRPVLVGLMLMGLVATVFGMPFQTLLPVFARDILHVGASGLGWLGGLGGVGALAGSLTVAFFSNPRQMRLLLVTGGIGLGVFIAFFALSTLYPLSLALVLILGFLLQIFMTSNFTLVQVTSPDHVRGRVMSIRMVALGMGPVGMFLLGVGVQVMGPAYATAVMGAIALLLMLLVLVAVPSLRRVEADVEDAATVQAEEFRSPAQ